MTTHEKKTTFELIYKADVGKDSSRSEDIPIRLDLTYTEISTLVAKNPPNVLLQSVLSDAAEKAQFMLFHKQELKEAAANLKDFPAGIRDWAMTGTTVVPKCFRCNKNPVNAAASPMICGLDQRKIYFRDPAFLPVCSDKMCEAEAHRVTKQTFKKMYKNFTKIDGEEYTKLKKKSLIRYCACCNRTEEKSGPALSKCSRCKIFYYCNRDCQVKHWNEGHKKTCKAIGKVTR